jgi:hypothetical protein
MDMGDEEGMDMSDDMDMGDEEDMDMGDEEGMGDEEPASKSDIMNLEDKLDELMAEFESLMHGEEGMSGEEDMDMGNEEDMGDEEGMGDEEEEVMESVQLQKAPQPKHEAIKATSPVAANAGAKGPVGSVVKPTKIGGASETVPTGPKGPSSPYHTSSAGNLPHAGKFGNTPNGAKKVAGGHGESAPKPKSETVKAKSPVPESKLSKKRKV